MSVLVFQRRHTIELDGAATAVLMHDAGVPKTERILAEPDECTVTTMVARERMFEYLDEEQASMPSSLHSLIVRKRSQPRLAIAAPTRQELDVAGALILSRDDVRAIQAFIISDEIKTRQAAKAPGQ